jgi:hypothetical protein
MEKLLERDTGELPASVMLALATGRKESARNALLKILKTKPDNAFGWLCLAVTLPREEAVQAVKRALIYEPDNTVALRNLTRLQQSRQADFMLELDDIWQADLPEEEAPLLFSNETPTVNLRLNARLSAFGDDTPTICDVKRPLVSLASQLKAISQLPPLPTTETQSPVRSKVKLPQSPETHPPTKTEAQPPVKPKVKPPQPAETHPPTKPVKAASIEATKQAELVCAPLAPSERVKVAPEVKSKSLKVVEEKAAEGRRLSLLASWHGPMVKHLENEAACVNGHVPALISKPVAGLRLADAAPAQYKSSQMMPRLYTGPRPPLGRAPEPLFGFTNFGLVVTLLVVFLLIFVVILLASGSLVAVNP